MKILYSNCTTDYDKQIDIRERLEFIVGELKCPTWMLGNKYRYRLATEKRELIHRLNRYDRNSND